MAPTKSTPGLSLAPAKASALHALAAHLPGAVMLGLVIIGLVVIAGLGYRVSLWLHPCRLCRHCGGSGRVRGFLPWSWSVCGWCDHGLVPRFGAHLVTMRRGASR
jgi:hypothetical protein